METENTWAARRESRRKESRSEEALQKLLSDKERTLQAQHALLVEAYTELQKLQKENKELKEKLHDYQNPADGYRKDWTWVAKIVFMLEQGGRPMATKEIIEQLEKREPVLREQNDKGKFFSAFLNQAIKHERIHREKRKGERGFYYYV